jgi:dehydrogenase/reductase SDR family member 4
MLRTIDILFQSTRIGFAIARRLAREGARVVISSRKKDNVEKAVAELRKEKLDIYGTVCHVSKGEDRQRLLKETIDKYGQLDILVSNAAISPAFGNILEVVDRAREIFVERHLFI